MTGKRLLGAGLLAAILLLAMATPAMAATKRTTRIMLDSTHATVDRTAADSVASPVDLSGTLQQRVGTKVSYKATVTKSYRVWHRVKGHLKYYTVYYKATVTKHKTVYSWKPLSGTVAVYASGDTGEWDSRGTRPLPGAVPVASLATAADGSFSTTVSEHGEYFCYFAGTRSAYRVSDDGFVLANIVGTSLTDPVVSVEALQGDMSRITVSYSVGWNTAAADGGGMAIAAAITQDGEPVPVTGLRALSLVKGKGSKVKADSSEPDAGLILQSIPAPGDYSFSFVLPTANLDGKDILASVAFMLSDNYVEDGSVTRPDLDEAETEACLANLRTVDGAIATYNSDHPATPIVTSGPGALSYDEAIALLVPDYIEEAPYCPTGGTYFFNPNGAVECSVHGTIER